MKGRLRKQQSKFTRLLAHLILYAYDNGYEITFGDVWAKDGHSKNSLHYDRLAADLNLFRDGEYLIKTEAHRELGEYWESLNPDCRWGGSFSTVRDGNHYEMCRP